MKTRRNQQRKRGSAYPQTAPSHDQTIADQIRDRAVIDLMKVFRVYTTEDPFYIDGQEVPAIGPEMGKLLLNEAGKLTTDQKEHGPVVGDSIPYLIWALKHTPQRNPRILAQFAVNMAWDFCYRIDLLNTLSYHWPTQWKWSRVSGKARQEWWPDVTDYHPPISPRHFQKLLSMTGIYAGEVVRPANPVDPFCGLQASYLWAFDAIRLQCSP